MRREVAFLGGSPRAQSRRIFFLLFGFPLGRATADGGRRAAARAGSRRGGGRAEGTIGVRAHAGDAAGERGERRDGRAVVVFVARAGGAPEPAILRARRRRRRRDLAVSLEFFETLEVFSRARGYLRGVVPRGLRRLRGGGRDHRLDQIAATIRVRDGHALAPSSRDAQQRRRAIHVPEFALRDGRRRRGIGEFERVREFLRHRASFLLGEPESAGQRQRRSPRRRRLVLSRGIRRVTHAQERHGGVFVSRFLRQSRGVRARDDDARRDSIGVGHRRFGARRLERVGKQTSGRRHAARARHVVPLEKVRDGGRVPSESKINLRATKRGGHLLKSTKVRDELAGVHVRVLAHQVRQRHVVRADGGVVQRLRALERQ